MENVDPYLHLLKPQSEVILNFLRQRSSVRKLLEGNNFTPSTKEEREEIEGEFHEQLQVVKTQPQNVSYLPSPEELAGILELGGMLNIFRHNTVHQSVSYTEYTGLLELKTPYTGMLTELQKKYKGSLIPADGKESYVWNIQERSLLNVLNDIEPHMVLRSDEVKLLIDFLKLQSHYTRIRWESGYNPLISTQRAAAMDTYYQNFPRSNFMP